MWPILGMLIITLWIGIERFLYLSKATVDVDKLMSLLKSQIVVRQHPGRHQHL